MMNSSQKEQYFDNLAKSNQPFYNVIALTLRESEELEQCTFQPHVNQQGRRYKNMQVLFEKLHDQGQSKNEHMKILH